MTGETNADAKDGGRRGRMERLSRIYFSESGAAAEGGESPPAPVAFVPVLNGAGNGGEVAVESIRRCLDREGVSSLLADFDGEAYRLRGGNGTGLDGPALLDRLRAESDLAVFFLILSAEPEERGLRLLCRGDISLLLVDSEVPSLKAAYLVLKRLNAIERGTMPALLSVSPRRSAWDGLAHRRLAEAAERFLHRRVAVWDAEGPDRTAARIADGLRRMRSRKERGVDPLLRRIAPLVEGDD